MNFSIETQRLLRMAHASESIVLLTGPTGTGKTTLAKNIHDRSVRRQGPFVSVNLGTLSEGVLESELFGHAKGAFTGADQKRIGKLELAQGGTVFLDEVSELPLRLQARLLDFIQFKTICPVGSNQSLKLDVRIIVATHKDLLQAVRRGEFREDLYYRLRVLSISLPPLKDRVDELDSIVHQCLQASSTQLNRSIWKISKEVAEKFESYTWPGNLRELRNVLDFAVLSAEGSEITLQDLPPWMGQDMIFSFDSKVNLFQQLTQTAIDLNLTHTQAMAEFEKTFLATSLGRYKGRVNQTARSIGMNKTTLLRRIKEYEIKKF